MPAFCSVIKCSSRAERDKVSFFRIPAAFKNRGPSLIKELSKERRELWIKALKRGPLSEGFLKNARICSRHFINGKDTKLF
uniref:Uncharacterized protein LOC114349271 n=1 Tax=Diabrotica virgifera virgifera TaxID=50390 RepID=A0A6P7H0B4_DIAVI